MHSLLFISAAFVLASLTASITAGSELNDSTGQVSSLERVSQVGCADGWEASCDADFQQCPRCESLTRRTSLPWFDGLDRLDELFLSTRANSGRWALAEYDFDNRGYNVLHLMGHSPLPLGFSLWGFIDLEGAEGIGGQREDISRHFLELDLKRSLWGNTGAIAELNDVQGQDNEIGRFGFFWQPDMSRFSPRKGMWAGSFRLGFKCFPLQTVSDTSQWSFNWNKQFDTILDSRVSAGGFFDFNYSPNRNVIVTEHQIRLQIAEGLHLITEFRLNEFLVDDFGIAPGIQYRF